jgi:hypothetical protein
METKRNFNLEEFDSVRDEIVGKIKDTPKKHADNLITDLKRTTENVTMHSRLISAVSYF